MANSVINSACIISIGDELLCGRTVDTNSSYIQQHLLKFGITVDRVTVIKDSKKEIIEALNESVQSLVFVTGGLGPTHDDITVNSVAEWAGVPVLINEDVEADLKNRCKNRGTEYHYGLAKQAKLPSNMLPLLNSIGSAPGQIGKFGETVVVLLPGVPVEMKGLWPKVEDQLKELGMICTEFKSFRFRTVGLSEPKLTKMTEACRNKYSELNWSWWLSRWGVDVQASGQEKVAEAEQEVKALLGSAMFGVDEQNLNEVVGELLINSGSTVSVAESCTAGMVGAAMTDLPGSSAYFCGGVITYSNEIKNSVLQVENNLLEKHGAVSQECAEKMAVNCREKFNTDYAISVTGISGPEGGTAEKPVGTTWIAVSTQKGVFSKKFRFLGYRQRARELSVAAALNLLRLQLSS